jgi:protein-tyrosine phosphatase
MSLVIPGLILGSLQESFDRTILSKYKVTHILNVASECNITNRIDLIYDKFGVPDDCHLSDISTILYPCLEFIHNARTNGGCVLVHCLEGVSRSVCVVLAYLVKKEGWVPEVALEHLAKCRPNMDPFPLYLRQTLSFFDRQTEFN